ncbi:MAG: hypothetical protein OEV93_04220 [Candidatus Moranbacteria bacterium]|nr:hypothetical protein [Candidatus Moranbacteria bacterium]
MNLVLTILISLFAVNGVKAQQEEQRSANSVMVQVWAGYFGHNQNCSEFVVAKTRTVDWEEKEFVAWINYDPGEALFALGSDRRFSGTLYVPGNDLMGFDVYVNPNGRRVKSKPGGFEEKISGTEISYIDLARLIRVGDMKYEFLEDQSHIKGTPQEGVRGDYDYIVFQVSSEYANAIDKIEYYSGGKIIKTQYHYLVQWFGLPNGQKVWRPGRVRIESGNDSFTEIEVSKRLFFEKPFDIKKKALEKGRP